MFPSMGLVFVSCVWKAIAFELALKRRETCGSFAANSSPILVPSRDAKLHKEGLRHVDRVSPIWIGTTSGRLAFDSIRAERAAGLRDERSNS